MASSETSRLPCSMVVAHFYLQGVPMALMNEWASPTEITLVQWTQVADDFVSVVASLLTRHGHMKTSEPTPPMAFLELLDASRDVTPASATPTIVARLRAIIASISLSLSLSLSFFLVHSRVSCCLPLCFYVHVCFCDFLVLVGMLSLCRSPVSVVSR